MFRYRLLQLRDVSNQEVMSEPPPPYDPSSDQQQQQPGGNYPEKEPFVGSKSSPEHSAVTYYAPTGPPQQHYQQLVIVPGATVGHTQPPQSFVAHIVFSCFVFWCCGGICGLIAFVLARK